MKVRYEFVDPSINANKFWEIEYPVDGDSTVFRTSWGRIGHAPATKVKEWPSAAKAEAEAQKLTATKEREGYRLVNAREGKVGKVGKKASGKKFLYCTECRELMGESEDEYCQDHPGDSSNVFLTKGEARALFGRTAPIASFFPPEKAIDGKPASPSPKAAVKSARDVLLKSGVPFEVSSHLLKRINNYLAKLEPEGKSQKREFKSFRDAVRAGTFTDGKRTVVVVPKGQAAVLAAVIDVARKMS